MTHYDLLAAIRRWFRRDQSVEELQHAIWHALSCEDTKLCPSCRKLMERAFRDPR